MKYSYITENQIIELYESCTNLYCFGKYIHDFEIGAGWYNIILKYSKEIEKILEINNKTAAVSQIKQKFGSICFYADFNDIDENSKSEINNYLKQLKQECLVTCEITGNPGILRKDIGWIRVLSDEKYNELKKNN